MASEVKRQVFGMSDKGQVVVVEKETLSDDGNSRFSTFEVRHGVRTVVEGVTQAQAESVAKALVGNLPPPTSAPPAPAMATHAAAVGAKVSRS